MTSRMNTANGLNGGYPRHHEGTMRRARGCRKMLLKTNADSVGTIVPSDQAFIDAILEQMDREQLSHPSFFHLNSMRQTETTARGELRVMHEHRLMYSDQVIFELSTSSYCNGFEMIGEISSCSLRDGCLRVKLSAKSCNANGNNNTWESFVFPVADIVKRSGLARQDEMLSASSDGDSPRWVGNL